MEIKPLQDKPYDLNEKPELVDSKERQLNIGEIVVIACYYTGSKQPPNVIAMSVMMELAKGGGEQIQFGNTVFIFHRTDNPRNIFFRALNADTAENYVENSMQFVQWAYQQGFDLGATEFEGELILKMIKMVAKKMHDEGYPGGGFKAWKEPAGQYRAAIRFGEPRG